MTLEYRCSNCGHTLATTNADPLHDEIERLQAENKTLFEEHRIAMNLLRENTATLESVAAERDKWKRAYEDARSLAALAIQQS